MNRTFKVTVGKTVRGGRVERKKANWETMIRKLGEFQKSNITMVQYQSLDQDSKANLKDGFGFFIGGYFKDDTRKKHSLVAKTLVSLDLDFLDPWDVDSLLDTFSMYEFMLHTTMSHTPEKPKLRMVFPVKRDVTLEEYEPLARKIADWFSIDSVDKVSYRPAQLMYWPGVCADGKCFAIHGKGIEIDPDAVLGEYDDWTDFGSWPRAERDAPLRPPSKRAMDPTTKPGVIGAFCRSYDVHSAISTFDLPYEGTETPDRYTPRGSTGGAGAIVYDDGLFLYSHHSQDAAADKNLNAWDLVRLCRFGSLDEGIPNNTPLGSLPSQKEMIALAMKDERVQSDMAIDPTKLFANLEAGEEPEKRVVDSRLKFDNLYAEINATDPKTLESELLKECKGFIVDIASARCDPAEETMLVRALQPLWPVPGTRAIPLKALADQVDVIRKRLTAQIADSDGGISDIEFDFIQEVLNEHWEAGEHLRRAGQLWWTYESGRWYKDHRERVRGMFTETIRRLRIERPEDSRELVAAVGEFRTSALTGSMATMFENTMAAKSERDDPLGLTRRFPLPIVNMRNCELHFDHDGSWEMRDHDPANFFTSQIDANYDPKAHAGEWDRFCRLIFQDHQDPEGMKRHLEELGGYIVSMSRWLKTWVLFYGPGDNGKSSISAVFQGMLGESALARDINRYAQDNRSEFAEADLIGKLLLIDDDFSKGALLPDGFLKTISEEKPLTTSVKYADSLKFMNRALPVILSNHLPTTRDLSPALRNRALVFPLSYVIRNGDDARQARMINDPQERSGALNRFVEGLKRLRARGGWDLPVDCRKAVNEWVARSNPLTVFVEDCLVLDHDIPVTRCAKASDVKGSYYGWCAAEGIAQRHRLQRRHLFEQLAQLGYPISASKQAGYFRVVGVKGVHAITD